MKTSSLLMEAVYWLFFSFFKKSLLLCLIYLQDLALLPVHQIKSFSNNTEFEDFSSPPQLIPHVWINDFLWAETPQNSFYFMLCKTDLLLNQVDPARKTL